MVNSRRSPNLNLVTNCISFHLRQKTTFGKVRCDKIFVQTSSDQLRNSFAFEIHGDQALKKIIEALAVYD